MLEYEYSCPYCMEYITILIDPTIRSQAYIEDCQVCCNPIGLEIGIAEGEIITFNAQEIGQ